MECPKCHYERKPGDKGCPKCGIIYEKWERHITHKQEEENLKKESTTLEHNVEKDSFSLGEKILKYKYLFAGTIIVIIIGYFLIEHIKIFNFTPNKETPVVIKEGKVNDENSQQKTAATQMLTGIQEDYNTLSSSATDEDGLPQLIEEKIDTTPKANGEFGEIERFIKTYMNKMVSQGNDYMQELDEIGWKRILEPERIRQDKNLLESQVMIQRAKEVVDKYRSKAFDLYDDMREEISNLNLSENLKQALATGFDTGMEESRPQIEMLWDMEAQIVSEFENIIKLLASKEGSWMVENKQILFKNGSDINELNSYIAEIQKLVAKEKDIQNQSVETMNNRMNIALDKIQNY